MRLIVVVVAVGVLFAGCLGGGGGSAGSAATEPKETGAAAEGTSASDGSNGPSAPDSGSDRDADGAADVGDWGPTDAEAALRDAGSFTATWTYRGSDRDGTRGEVSYTYYADLDGDRAHVLFSTTGGDEGTTAGWERFSTAGRTYSRYGSGTGAFYQVQEEAEFDVVGDTVSRAGVYAYDDTSGLAFRGTERYDGVTVGRYELTDARSVFRVADAAVRAADTGVDDGIEIQEFEYVVLIDDDGLPRYESWSYTGTTPDGETIDAAWEYSLTGVGSTSFEDPAWVAAAEAQGRQTGG